MIDRNASQPAEPAPVASRTLAAIAQGAALTVALAVASTSFALAQQPKKPPAKKPEPAQQQAAPQQPAAPQQSPQEPVQLIYSPWTKFCAKPQEGNGKQICFTAKDARIESGMPVVGTVLIEPEGEAKKFRVTVPLGMALVYGTRVIIDQDQPLTAPYVVCIPTGCVADYDVSADMIGKLKKGKDVVVQAIKMNGQPLSIPVSLSDFAKAYDGPPTDPKVFEAQQKKLEEELQKRAEEARKKLEQSQPAAAATPPGKTQ